MQIIRFIILNCFLVSLIYALNCEHCKKKITKDYIQRGNHSFCSKSCSIKSLPKCKTCSKALTGRYIKHNNHLYCSQNCLSVLFPKCELCKKKVKGWVAIRGANFCKSCVSLHRCHECRLPFSKGVKLKDQRKVCATCKDKTLIKDLKQAEGLYKQAQNEAFKITGKKSKILPKLDLVDYPSIQKISKMTGNIRGFYSRQEEGNPKDGYRLKSKTIYILNYMTKENFMATAVHEFCHDVQAEFYPKLMSAPLWIQEGLAQYVAAIYCRKMNYKTALYDIENSKDPTYGDSYRYLKKKFGENNWSAIDRWLRTTNLSRLPSKSPK